MGIYDYRPATGGYGETVRDWRSAGFGLEDLDDDGTQEIVTADVRFGDSFPPPAVFMYLHQDGVPVIVDVTTKFPALIRQNAAAAKRRLARLRRGDPDAAGYVTVYVADQYLLGRGAAGLRELDRQVARGLVSKSFKRRLLKLLRRYGYR
jgi:hypothetical protein